MTRVPPVLAGAPLSVVDVEGNFGQHECVRIFVLPTRESPLSEGEDVGKALVNYSAAEIKRIRGVRSSQIADIIGYADSEYVAHRESIALYKRELSRPVTPMTENKRWSMGRLSSYVDA